MAYSVKVTGVHLERPWLGDNPEKQYLVWGAELPWWDSKQLREDARFRRVFLNDGYADFVAILTQEEFMDLQQKYVPETNGWRNRLITGKSTLMKSQFN